MAMNDNIVALSDLMDAVEDRNATVADRVTECLAYLATRVLARNPSEHEMARLDISSWSTKTTDDLLSAFIWTAKNCPRRRGDIGLILAAMRPA